MSVVLIKNYDDDDDDDDDNSTDNCSRVGVVYIRLTHTERRATW